MTKPEIRCPNCGQILIWKLIASWFGQISQWRYQQRKGKKKYNQEKAENFKKTKFRLTPHN